MGYFKHILVISVAYLLCILQTLQRMLHLNQGLNVVEKLLPFVKLGFLAESLQNWLHSWHFYHNHATKELLQGQMCRIKETTNPTRNAAWFIGLLQEDPNLTKRRSFSTTLNSNCKHCLIICCNTNTPGMQLRCPCSV